MPILIAIWMITTTSMASLRSRFPDEEKGVMNLALVKCGFAPPDIPAPSEIRSVWSGAPMQKLDDTKEFMTLGLTEVLKSEQQLETNEQFIPRSPVLGKTQPAPEASPAESNEITTDT